MSYLVAADLESMPGALEIAQVATPSHLDVPPVELMRLTLIGGDRTEYASDQVAAADAALARVAATIADAEQIVDGYIGARYALPLSPVPPICKSWVRALVRYALNQSRISDERTDPIARDRRDAIRVLESVAAGKFSLGASDPVVNSSGGDVQFVTPGRVFTADTLRDY